MKDPDPLSDGVKKARPSPTGLLVHGFFILLPIMLIGWMVVELFLALQEVVRPVIDAMPGIILRHRATRFLAVCVVFAALMLLVGWMAQTRGGKAVGRWLEAKILYRVPFYSLLRNLTSSLADNNDATSLRPVLVTVDVPGLQQLGFIVERHANGSATVFLPSSPAASSGTVVVVDPPRICELRVPGRQILKCLGRWGEGTAELLQKAGSGLDGNRSGESQRSVR